MTVSPAPVCTVCIANYNGESLLADCIDSVLNQKCDFLVEIIVHDDASTDKSIEFLASRYPQVKVIASQTNVGFCIGNNRMVVEATGQYILLLNNDATLTPDALKTLHEHAIEQIDQGILTLPQYDFATGELIDRGCLLDPFFNPVPNLDPGRCDVAMVIGACLWIPRQLWKELGGFPEWFGSIGEDLYICCCSRLAGYPVRVCASSGYTHRVGFSFGGGRVRQRHMVTTLRRRALSERNKTFVMAITCPSPLVWVLLPVHLSLLVAEGILLSIIKLRSTYLTEIYWPVVTSLFQRRRELKEAHSLIRAANRISAKAFFSAFNLVPYKLKMLLRHGLPKII